MKTLWTFERSESIHPLNAARPRTGLTKFECDSIQHSIFENRKQHVASASVLLRNVCITSWTTISSSLSSSSIWILMMIESRVIEALFRSTLSLNQGSSSCRRPPNLISRLIGEEGGAIKFGKKLIHDWRRRWQTNPILKISDWIGLPAAMSAVWLPCEPGTAPITRDWRSSRGGYSSCIHPLQDYQCGAAASFFFN